MGRQWICTRASDAFMSSGVSQEASSSTLHLLKHVGRCKRKAGIQTVATIQSYSDQRIDQGFRVSAELSTRAGLMAATFLRCTNRLPSRLS